MIGANKAVRQSRRAPYCKGRLSPLERSGWDIAYASIGDESENGRDQPAYLGVNFNNLLVGGVLGLILAEPLSVST